MRPPTILQPGDAETIEVMGSRVTIHVTSEASGGAFSVVEMEVPGGFRAPRQLHRHLDVDWWALVQAGEIAIELGDDVKKLRAGSVVVVPRGVAFRSSR